MVVRKAGRGQPLLNRPVTRDGYTRPPDGEAGEHVNAQRSQRPGGRRRSVFGAPAALALGAALSAVAPGLAATARTCTIG
jgi:hypothetical protein